MSKVLLIDSNTSDASTLAQFLTANNYKVTTVGDGRSALVHLKQHKSDIIIMAAELPQANGYALCNRLKKDPAVMAIPLVMFSASPNAEATFIKHQALPTHADYYMRKPVKLDLLLAQMQALLSHSQHAAATEVSRKTAEAVVNSRAEGATTIYRIPDEILKRNKEPEATRMASAPIVPKAFDEECTISSSSPSPIPVEIEVVDTSDLEKENRELKEKILSLQKAMKKQEAALNQQLASDDSKGSELLSLKNELNNAEQQLAEKDEQYAVVAERLERLAEKAKSLMNERDDLKNLLEEAHNTIKRERSLSETAQAELNATLDTNKSQLKALHDEVSGLESRLTNERQKEAKAHQALQLAMQIIEEAGLLEE